MFNKEHLQEWFQTHNTNPMTSHIVTPDMLRRPRLILKEDSSDTDEVLY